MEHQHIRRLVLDAEARGSRKYTQEKGSKKKFHNKKATITVTLMTVRNCYGGIAIFCVNSMQLVL
jgi:hypothetical protein